MSKASRELKSSGDRENSVNVGNLRNVAFTGAVAFPGPSNPTIVVSGSDDVKRAITSDLPQSAAGRSLNQVVKMRTMWENVNAHSKTVGKRMLTDLYHYFSDLANIRTVPKNLFHFYFFIRIGGKLAFTFFKDLAGHKLTWTRQITETCAAVAFYPAMVMSQNLLTPVLMSELMLAFPKHKGVLLRFVVISVIGFVVYECIKQIYTLNWYYQRPELMKKYFRSWKLLISRVYWTVVSYLTRPIVKDFNVNHKDIEKCFMKTPLKLNKQLTENNVKMPMADRDNIRVFTIMFATETKTRPYHYQMSRTDQDNGDEGSREFYWASDLDQKEKPYDPPDDALIVMTDVDYHLDMPRFMIENMRPIFLKSFQPSVVARSTDRYNFTFIEDKVVYQVGASRFNHAVWNYSVKHIIVSDTLFGFKIVNAMYTVTRRPLGPDHEAILLLPRLRWYGPTPSMSVQNIAEANLERLSPQQANGYNRMLRMDKDERYYSVGRPGTFVSTSIDFRKDQAIAVSQRNNSMGITQHTVQSFFGGSREDAAPIYEYYNTLTSQSKENVYVKPSQGVRSYQFEPTQFDEKAKPTLVGFMNAVVNDAFAPSKSPANERSAINGRLVGIAPPELQMTLELHRNMDKFLEFLIPFPGMMQPMDDSVVYERQDKPNQRRILEQSQGDLPDRQNKAFMKPEAYQKVTEPRIISTVNGVDKRDYSQYTYSFETLMKYCDWYAFGKTPVEVADRVAKVLTTAKHAIISDFSRFDGRVSNLVRELETRALKRAFDIEHHAEVLELHSSQFFQNGRMPLGTKFNTGYARCSGSPETSLFNSMDNAFVAFDTFVKQGCDYKEAWGKLGIYGGDDGITADIDGKAYVEAAACLGMKLEAEPLSRGSLGIKFLSRHYGPGVWEGDNNSCCDIKRQISKFHTTPHLPSNVTPLEKMSEKVYSYILTDENTPIIGDICKTFHMVSGGDVKRTDKTLQMRSWISKFDKKVQYPNTRADWMIDIVNRDLEGFQWKRFDKWLMEAKTPADMLIPPLCIEMSVPKPAAPAVVDGAIYPLGVVIDPATEAKVPVVTKKPRPIVNGYDKDKKDHANDKKKENTREWKTAQNQNKEINKSHSTPTSIVLTLKGAPSPGSSSSSSSSSSTSHLSRL